ncbi:TRAP transporter substrate-binding protein [Pelagibius sp. 7325]|uniref:TRAP transporter substrate-binding protein n=1 Tax=Pelagibius sp. 7325 TaxID=3131994 RepID=UPI0030ED3C2D
MVRNVAAALALVLSTAAAFCLPSPAQAQEGTPQVTLRLHQMLPPQAAIPARALIPWIEKVERESQGRIKVEHYPSMQLGGAPPSLYDQARDGVVDLIWTVLGYTPGRFPKSEAFELPFMVTTAEATSRAFHEYALANAMDEFKDVHPIALHTHGPGLLHVKGEGVHSLEDMQGLKIRTPNRVASGMLSTFGATPIGMPVPAVPESLAKGVIDGVAIPWEVTLPLKIAELVNTHTAFSGDHGLYTSTFIFAMNRDSYERLPADLKQVIDANSGPEVAALFGRAMDEVDVIGRGVAEKAGNSLVTLDAAETARWQEAARKTTEDWIVEMRGKGIDGAGLVADARRRIEKYSGQ